MLVVFDEELELEFDICVVSGDLCDYCDAYFECLVLIVEVLLLCFGFDCECKGSFYVWVGIIDYWIVNILDLWVEVYCESVLDGVVFFGWCYGCVVMFGFVECVFLLVVLVVVVVVVDLFL